MVASCKVASCKVASCMGIEKINVYKKSHAYISNQQEKKHKREWKQ
jgi:hypothetical protein